MVSNKAHALRRSIAPETGRTVADDTSTAAKTEELQEYIRELSANINELETFYNVKLSRARLQRLGEYLGEPLVQLVSRFSNDFENLSKQAQVDYLLAWNYVTVKRWPSLRAEWHQLDQLKPLVAGWASGLVELCEKRQKVERVLGQDAAKVLSDASKAIDELSTRIKDGKLTLTKFTDACSEIRSESESEQGSEPSNRFTAYRAAQQIEQLHEILKEWYAFYEGYDPLFTWWTSKPWADLSAKLQSLVPLIREQLVGIKPGEEDAIVGQPIGKDQINNEIAGEMIAYSAEELIQIAEREYEWCEKEAIKASQDMGLGKDWKKALEHVKDMHVEPGEQTYMVRELAQEAIDYVTKHDMVTVPEIAKECWRTFMMPPAQQKVSPFFLGGTYIQIAYPTNTMTHEDKLMIMRGNSRPLSRSTVFHELVPGHHLQYHYMARSKTHRVLFETPFWIEGWAFYWEMILWDRGFPNTPENRMGMLFWRMHRCARIVFSMNFHLGKWSPQQCIDYLVDEVGHERATAEGEVRRSFNGDYGALYQAGYMIGALQIYALRKEVVDTGKMTEKQFHDRILKENTMPIEMVRALLTGKKLERTFKPAWRFYDL